MKTKFYFVISIIVLLTSCSIDESNYYNLTISLNPINSGTVSPEGGKFEEGSEVNITFNPNRNFSFESWSGDTSGNQNPITILIDGNKNLIANAVPSDDDADGIINTIDQCDNTPIGENVNEQGCSTSQIDTDGDGVFDNVDQDNETRIGVPVDQNGVMLNPIYLDGNGVTIKSREWGIVGDVGYIEVEPGQGYTGAETNRVNYTIVNRAMIEQLLNQDNFLNRICTSLVTDTSQLFMGTTFYVDIDISNWDVSNVTDMSFMFQGTSFAGDISNWDVSNVIKMNSMFYDTPFDGDLSNWNVSNVTQMANMFGESDFNNDISNWDVSSVDLMYGMFTLSPFNGDISNWNVSNVTRMDGMFQHTPFNRNISTWDVSNVTNMLGMFLSSQFNQDISNWNLSNVNDVSYMFDSAELFNRDLSSWNVSNVTECEGFSNFTPQWILPKPNFTNCNQ